MNLLYFINFQSINLTFSRYTVSQMKLTLLFSFCLRFLEDEVLDLAEYTDGMVTYGFSEDEAHEAFHKFAVVIILRNS